MILDVCGSGHVAAAAREAAEGLGRPILAATLEDDLFAKAAEQSSEVAIVFALEPRLLEPANQGSSGRIDAVLRGAHAPRVRRLVVVCPTGEGWDAELRALQRDGAPYTIVRSRPLLEEVADTIAPGSGRSIWLPRGKTVELASRAALAEAIRDAIARDDTCGSTLTVSTERLDLGEAMRRASTLAGADLRVHVAPPGISFAMRKLSSWMGRESPAIEALCDRLGSDPRVTAAA